MDTATKLRSLTEAEQKAADMIRSGALPGVVMSATKLTREQVLEAVELAKGWEEKFVQMNGAMGGSRPANAAPEVEEIPAEAQTPPVAEVPIAGVEIVAEAEPAADDATEPESADDSSEPAEFDDLPGILRHGLESTNLRVLELARTVQRHVAEIRTLLEADEKTRTAREEIERLEAELAAKEVELAAKKAALTELAGGKPAPRRARVAKPAAAKPIGKALNYSAKVRAWAVEQNMRVGTKGQIPKGIVAAYVKAHPGE